MASRYEQRMIDRLPNLPRERPMEVLCLGLSRTATMSMHTALTQLGHKTYHFKEVTQIDDPDRAKLRSTVGHVQVWREAFRLKLYGEESERYGKAEWDKLLRRYSAVTDAPCACFADELIAAYPTAKVILTLRDTNKWLASMETAYYALLESREWRWFRAVAALDYDVLTPYVDLLMQPMILWTGGDWRNRKKLATAFEAHYEHVRSIVPKDNLLEWRAGDGWEPLCKFLDVPVPDEPFPFINKGDSAAQMHKPFAYFRLVTLIKTAVRVPIMLMVGATIIGLFGWILAKYMKVSM